MSQMSIAGYNMISIVGKIPPWKNEVQALQRPGVDGYTFRKMGKRSAPFSLETKATCKDMTAARALEKDYAERCGKLVSVKMASGQDVSGVMVLDVISEAKPLVVSSDGNNAIVIASWQLQRSK